MSLILAGPQAGDAVPNAPDRARRGLWGAIFLGWWTLFALIYSHHYYTVSAYRGEPMSWADALGIGFLDMYLWALLCLAAFVLARHLPLTAGRWRWSIPVHIAAATAMLVGRLPVENFFAQWIGALEVAPLSTKLLAQTPSHAITYVFLVGVGYGIEYYRQFIQREFKASQLEAQLACAQLQVLNMQLHPHFLFNTLNAISALMHSDVNAADRMLARLEDLLRLSLERAHTQEVALKDELECLAPYLEIEQTRFGDRLSVEWRIDPEALDARVPHLILQPLVENAIKHGIAPRAAAGQIAIHAKRRNGALHLEVRDNGLGLGSQKATPTPHPNGNGVRAGSSTAGAAVQRRALAPDRKGGGVGLTNTRARLSQLYNGKHTFAITNAPDGGVVVALTIPFRTVMQDSNIN